MLQLFSMIKSKDGIKCRGDFFWSVVDFSFEKQDNILAYTSTVYCIYSTFVLYCIPGFFYNGIFAGCYVHQDSIQHFNSYIYPLKKFGL